MIGAAIVQELADAIERDSSELGLNRKLVRAIYPAVDWDEYDREVVEESGAVAALEQIKSEEGKVCAQYEMCHHTGCSSSYGAWAIADSALRSLRGEA